MKYDELINLSPLPGSKSKELLDNPDRGFRLEVATDAEVDKNPFKPGFDRGIDFLQHQFDYYKEDKPKLAQTYFYLSQYEEKMIDDKGFETMQRFLDELRKLKLKAVLRFTYETDFGGPKAPTNEWALKHMKQLTPFLEKNKDVIHVYQAGIIGAWGEWHSSKHELNEKAILEGIMDMVPEGIQVQVRLPIFKNLISSDNPQYNRIGFHDDFIVIEPHVWDAGLNPASKQYIQMAEESPFVLVDGELPWGSWSLEEEGWLIDGFGTIKRLSDHRYTSLSLVHNYRENGDEIKYSFTNWKEIDINEEWLIQNKLHFSEAWFRNDKGERVGRTVFEYIRDHLGYRLEATKLEIGPEEKESAAIAVKIDIVNHGFAAPIGLETSELVILNKKGEVLHSVSVDSPAEWHPHAPSDDERKQLTHSIIGELPNSCLTESCMLGLRICNASGEGARLANDIQFENGINILIALN